MKIEDYEKYYQKGGSYVIPTEVFNELFNELEAWKEQVKNIETIRLDQTKKVFDTIANITKEGSCSYRHLIYDELGFGGKYYEELISGMTITNAICDLEELKEQREEDLKEMEKLTSIWKAKNEEIRQLKKQLHEASLTIQEMIERDVLCPSNCDKLDKLIKENEELKKQLEEIEFIVGLRQKRNLISKFDKEYDEEDKKKNPNRDYAGITPDAEEVYRRYYTMKNQQKEFIKYLEDKIKEEKDNLEKLCELCKIPKENNGAYKFAYSYIKKIEEILQKYRSVIGVSDENNKQ